MKQHNINQKTGFFLKTVLALAVLGFAQGCKKQLDISPVSDYTSASYFQNVGQAQMALYGVYQKLTAASLYGEYLTMYYAIDNDEAKVSGEDDDERRGLGRYKETSSNLILESESNNTYNDLYSGIERANICIDRIPQMAGFSDSTSDDYAKLRQYYGEALALRSIFYFDLIRNWGDVPFTLKPAQVGDDFYLPRTSRDVIYDTIIANLHQAESLVPWQSALPVQETLSKNAIKGIRARIALSAAGYSLRPVNGTVITRTSTLQMSKRNDAARIKELYQIASDECREIIEHGENELNPSFKQLFLNYVLGIIEPKESMFEVGFHTYVNASSSTTPGGGYYGNYNGMYIALGTLFGDDVKTLNGMQVVPSYFYSFDTLDTRMTVTNVAQQITTSTKGTGYGTREGQSLDAISVGKWRMDMLDINAMPMIDTRRNDINYCMLRYADVLLMYAEAENEINNGPTEAAIKYYEEVRKRAFGVAPYGTNSASLIGTTPTDYQGFANAIVNERSWELGHEGWRKNDLIRWNLLGTKLREARSECYKLYNKEGKYSYISDTIWYKPQEINVSSVVDTFKFYYTNRITSRKAYSSKAWLTKLKPDSKTGVSDQIERIGRSFEDNKDELFPIPQTAVDGNPNLEQLPGF
jgi:hypothetical protein